MEGEEPDEYDNDGLLRDAVWDPEENDDEDELWLTLQSGPHNRRACLLVQRDCP